MSFLPQKQRESGQTLVIVLLVIAVSLMVGVGIATRSTSVVQQTTFSEEATQALHFAEACAEEALKLIKVGTIHSGNLPYNDSLSDVDSDLDEDCNYGVTELSDIFPGVVDQDEVAEMKIIRPGFDCTSVTVYWCNSSEGDDCDSTNYEPALEVIWVRTDEIKKEIYGSPGERFRTPSGGGGTDYAFSVSLDVDPDNDEAVRFIPRFGDSHILVQPSGCSLGHQGYRVRSEGNFGRSTREVEVTKTEAAMPAIFDYTIFSGSDTEPLEKR